MAPARRITVTGKDGLQGTIDADSLRGKEPVELLLDDGRRVFVPAEMFQRGSGGRYELPLGLNDLSRAGGDGEDGQIVVPLVEEELRVGKQTVETGRVRVHKTVHEREAVVDEPLLHEDVVVTRVPVNAPVSGPVAARQEGDTLIVPLLEEVLVVEKRLVVREELRITRRRTEVRQPRTVQLRSEEATVEHYGGSGNVEDAPPAR